MLPITPAGVDIDRLRDNARAYIAERAKLIQMLAQLGQPPPPEGLAREAVLKRILGSEYQPIRPTSPSRAG